MHPVRRILCIVIGAALLYGAALLGLPMIEAGRVVTGLAVSALVMVFVGGLLVLMGVFPNLTRNW